MDEGKEQDMSTLSDLEDFFQPEEGTEEEVTTQIARITEKALHGPKSKKDDEKLHELKQKHKQPKNIQVLHVEEFIWGQLYAFDVTYFTYISLLYKKNHFIYYKYFNTFRLLDGFSFKRSSRATAGC